MYIMLTKLCKLGVITQISMFTFWSTSKVFRAFNKKRAQLRNSAALCKPA